MKDNIEVLGLDGDFHQVFTSPDGRVLFTHLREELRDKNLIFKGRVGQINNEKYWLFRDAENKLWLFGVSISPIELSDDVTAILEGSNVRRFALLKGKEICFEVEYCRPQSKIPAYYDFTAASMDDESGDFGLFIYNVLHDPERRREIYI